MAEQDAPPFQLETTEAALIGATNEQQRPLLLETSAQTAANVVERMKQLNQVQMMESVLSKKSKLETAQIKGIDNIQQFSHSKDVLENIDPYFINRFFLKKNETDENRGQR